MPRRSQSSATAARSGRLAATPPPSATASHSPCFRARSSFAISCPTAAAWKLGGEVGPALLDALRAEVPAEVDERRLQAAEAEVEAGVAGHRDRQLEGLGVAVRGQPFERRAARVAEAEQAGDLVEGLAGGVVERVPEDLVAGVVADRGQHRVAAAGDQAEEGRLERLGLEEVGGDVPLQVVDRDQRQAARRGDRLRGADPDQQRADQARARPSPRPPRRPRARRRPRSVRPPPPESASSRWWREATSGTTPPKRACASACEEIVLARILPPSSTAAQVSSQEVSQIGEDQSSHMISASSPLSW